MRRVKGRVGPPHVQPSSRDAVPRFAARLRVKGGACASWIPVAWGRAIHMSQPRSHRALRHGVQGGACTSWIPGVQGFPASALHDHLTQQLVSNSCAPEGCSRAALCCLAGWVYGAGPRLGRAVSAWTNPAGRDGPALLTRAAPWGHPLLLDPPGQRTAEQMAVSGSRGADALKPNSPPSPGL